MLAHCAPKSGTRSVTRTADLWANGGSVAVVAVCRAWEIMSARTDAEVAGRLAANAALRAELVQQLARIDAARVRVRTSAAARHCVHVLICLVEQTGD